MGCAGRGFWTHDPPSFHGDFDWLCFRPSPPNSNFRIFGSLTIALPTVVRPESSAGPAAVPTQFDHSRKESLGVELRPLEEALRDMVACMKRRGVLCA